MKILFLAYQSFDLYKPIESELIRQGHEVHTIKDIILPLDYYQTSSSKFRRVIKRLLRYVLGIEKKYWNQVIKDAPSIDEYYDELICYQGVSMCPYLLNILKKKNREIKVFLYVGDSSNYFDFYSRAYLYDKIYSFDIQDSKIKKNVELLDSYWTSEANITQNDIEYDITAIGSDHDDRMKFTKKIYPQLSNSNLRIFIRVVSPRPKEGKRSSKDYLERIANWESNRSLPFVSEESIPLADFNRIIAKSACILEVEREKQSGVTHRIIQALVNGKKVISTNKALLEMPYYNPEQIMIIDRDNPIIDIDWIKRKIIFERHPYFDHLRIDNWVKFFLIDEE